jgi:DNA-binding SARP family transcriptional activator
VALSHAYAARLRTETGQVEGAEKHLARAFAIARGMWNPLLAYQCHLVAADIAFARGEDESGLASLKEALAIGRERGYFHYENWLPSFMIRLCARALKEGVEVPYVQELIRRRKLVPDSPPLDLEAWPWPVRIYTLGRFEIFRDGKPLAFSRKVQKRPLSLLKAVIAFGGQAVREEMLADTVWPEAEGDMAYQSMSVALRRLRQLLGHEEAVQRREGLFTLDPRFCWVDAFAFERLLGKAASQREAGRGEEAADPEEKALALYRGPFLAEEAERSWAVSMRERLRSRYLSAVGRLGARYWQKGQSEKAREWYLKGIDVDNLAEEFYQSLIRCYLADRREAEALAVFERLKKTFSSLGVEPSPRTRNLLGSLRSN